MIDWRGTALAGLTTLTLAATAGEAAKQWGTPPPSEPTVPTGDLPGGQPIEVGQTLTGTLEAGDQQFEFGEYYDVYTFQGSPGQNVEIRMASEMVDTYLVLLFPDGETYENDDYGGTLNSGIDYPLTLAGTHQIICTSYAANETGQYQVSLNLAQGGQPGLGTPPASQPATGFGQPPANTGFGTPPPANTGFGTPPASQPATGFGPPPANTGFGTPPASQPATGYGQPPANTGFGTPPPANTGFGTPPASQPVTGFTQPGTGFTQPGMGQNPGNQQPGLGQPQTQTPTISGGSLYPGATVQGQLGQGDPQLQSGEYYDEGWSFTAQAGQQITVTMQSDEVDCYLLVLHPDGQVSENDDFGGTLNSQITISATQAGQYQIIPTTYRPGETGTYTLSLN